MLHIVEGEAEVGACLGRDREALEAVPRHALFSAMNHVTIVCGFLD
jgi:hypothetical protein